MHVCACTSVWEDGAPGEGWMGPGMPVDSTLTAGTARSAAALLTPPALAQLVESVCMDLPAWVLTLRHTLVIHTPVLLFAAGRGSQHGPAQTVRHTRAIQTVVTPYVVCSW